MRIQNYSSIICQSIIFAVVVCGLLLKAPGQVPPPPPPPIDPDQVTNAQQNVPVPPWPPSFDEYLKELNAPQPATGISSPQVSMEETYRLGFMAEGIGIGLRVVEVTADGPATKLRRLDNGQIVSLEQGDVITRVHGQAIGSLDDYYRAMKHCQSTGGQVELVILDVHTGQEFRIAGQAELQCSPSNSPRNPNVAYDLRIAAEPEQGGGMRLTSVDEQGPMARMLVPHQTDLQAAAEAGDVLVSVAGIAVNSNTDYQKAMQTVASSCGKTTIRLRNVRTGEIESWLVKAILTPVGNRDPNANRVVQPEQPVQPNMGSDRKAHLLICGLTDDANIGDHIKISLARLDQVINDRLDKQFIASRTVLDGSQCNAQTILQTVDRISMRPQDTLFVYYLGHGAYDPSAPPTDPSGGHFFQIPRQDLSRKHLYDKMIGKNARLTVLISDTCNVRSEVPPVLARVTPQLVQQQITGLTGFEKLLLESRGEIDISASGRDQYSWFSSPEGGWFTEQFIKTMVADVGKWRQALEVVSQRTSEFYQTKRNELLTSRPGINAATQRQLFSQVDMRPTDFHNAIQDDPYLGFDHNTVRIMSKTHYTFVRGR